jgi:hypothetical protein
LPCQRRSSTLAGTIGAGEIGFIMIALAFAQMDYFFLVSLKP